MAKKTKATSAEEKLRALYDLQLIDSRIDRLRVVRGELPLEVEDRRMSVRLSSRSSASRRSPTASSRRSRSARSPSSTPVP